MARKLRVEYEGAIYHLTVRGVERRKLFAADAERERFVQRLGEAVEACGVRLYLFCLMNNHVHLVAETPHGNVSAFMHKLQTAYTVYYNRRHRRAGHLMQGRFGAQAVQGDAYLLKLSRYVHLNPVAVGPLARQAPGVRREYLRRYPWSSYRGYAGLARPYAFMEEGPVLALTGEAAPKQRRAYRRFVEAGLAETDEEFVDLLRTSGWGLGDAEFQEGIRDRHTASAAQVRRPEDVSFRHMGPRREAGVVVKAVAEAFGLDASALRKRQYDCVARAVCAWLLGRYSGMNQRDIGGYLTMGMGSAVCRQLQRLRARQAEEPALAARVRRLRSVLEGRP